MPRSKKRRYCRECRRHFVPEDARKIEQPCPYCGQDARKKQSKKVLTERADWCFSRLARYKRADRLAKVRCCTCGAVKPWTEVDAGHYMSRRHRMTRWCMDNVWPQCKICNSGFGASSWKPNESIRKNYEEFLKTMLGDSAPDKLFEMAHTPWSPTEIELVDLVRKLEWECEVLGLM